MDRTDHQGEFFECVDRTLGQHVWRYDEPDLDPDLRRRLESHLDICDACRWDLGLERLVTGGLEEASLRIDSPGPEALRPHAASSQRWASGSATVAGALALAASLAWLLFLPPGAPDSDLIDRAGPGALRVLQPVESEVILGGRPRLAWTAVRGAVRYRITLREAEGPYAWVDSTRATEYRLPAAAAAPIGVRLRAFLEPVPTDLAPTRGVTVSFRTGHLGSFLAYRWQAAALGIRLLGLLGVALLAGKLLLRLWVRRSPDRI